MRNIIFEEKNDHQANKLNSEFKKKFSKEVNNEMIKLKNLINDQNKFSKAISQLINNLNLQQNNEEEKNESKENKNEEELKNNENEETKSDVVEQKDDDDLNTELGLSELSDKSDVNNEDLNEGKELEFSPENNKRFDNKLGNKLYKIFSREFDAIAHENDILIAISTSGNSKNILKLIQKSISKGIEFFIFTGATGGKLSNHTENSILVPSNETAIIQQCHILLGHVVCLNSELEYL